VTREKLHISKAVTLNFCRIRSSMAPAQPAHVTLHEDPTPWSIFGCQSLWVTICTAFIISSSWRLKGCLNLSSRHCVPSAGHCHSSTTLKSAYSSTCNHSDHDVPRSGYKDTSHDGMWFNNTKSRIYELGTHPHVCTREEEECFLHKPSYTPN
jgi:hypothetical protein